MLTFVKINKNIETFIYDCKTDDFETMREYFIKNWHNLAL